MRQRVREHEPHVYVAHVQQKEHMARSARWARELVSEENRKWKNNGEMGQEVSVAGLWVYERGKITLKNERGKMVVKQEWETENRVSWRDWSHFEFLNFLSLSFLLSCRKTIVTYAIINYFFGNSPPISINQNNGIELRKSSFHPNINFIKTFHF